MVRPRFADNPLLPGIIVGPTFGAMNLVVTWMFPLTDDTPRRAAVVLRTDVLAVGTRRVQSDTPQRAIPVSRDDGTFKDVIGGTIGRVVSAHNYGVDGLGEVVMRVRFRYGRWRLS
jgi:hypothetical protein